MGWPDQALIDYESSNMSQLSSLVRSATLFSAQRKRLPQTLVLFVTSRCNARCEFCLYRHRIEDPASAAEELTVEEIEKMASHYGPLHYPALSGGEPFVREDVPEICQAFIDRCDTAVVDIPSNFWFRERMISDAERLATRNPGVVVELQLALDHAGPDHDESRGVPGLYDRAKQTFEALAGLRGSSPNLRLKINVLYLERNRGSLREMIDRINRDFDYDRIQLTYPHVLLPPSPSGETIPLDEMEDYERCARFFEASSGVRNGTDLHTMGVSSSKVFYRMLLRRAIEGRRLVGDYCEAGRSFLVIDEIGRVMPCEPLWTDLGNLREWDYDVAAVLRGDRYARFRETHLGCGACNCTYSCAILGHVALSPLMVLGSGMRAVLGMVGSLVRRGRRSG